MSAAIEQRNQDATVYVGNLDDRVTEELLWELMLQAGSVCNVHMPRDKVTGAHQNYGFVEFRTEECAEYAVKVLNMIQLYGRVVRVKKASNDRKNLDVGANLFIGNLDPEVDEKLLYDTFSAFGASFDSFEAADLAIECMHGQYLCNRQVVVQYAYKKDSHNERHGSEAERLLAQRNPNKLKPHTMFAFTAGAAPAMDAPPPPPHFNQTAGVIWEWEWYLHLLPRRRWDGLPAASASSGDVEAVEQPRVYLIEKISVDGGKSTLKPAARGGATLTQIEETGVVYLIGGANREGTSFGDIHRFDLDTSRWTLIKPSSGSFPPRSGHSAVAIGAKIYVFGGLDAASSGIYNDVHIFDTQTSSWTKAAIKGETPLPEMHTPPLLYLRRTTRWDLEKCWSMADPRPTGDNQPLRWEKCTPEGEIPEARELHCALLQSETTVCFAGGRNFDGKVCTDMALLDFSNWTWQLMPICEWNRCSLAAGAVDGELIAFGGWDGGRICGDCCRYSDDEESWIPVITADSKEEKQPAEPSPSEIPERFGHCGTTVEIQTPSKPAEKSRRQGFLSLGV
ncbi:Kelch-type beta propeller [Phytophthora cactorum]|nr:Kelch-type beta propeller [Phytophthora cactorum]